VNEDGVMDLTASGYVARVSFHFRAAPPPEPPLDPSLPLGAPRPTSPVGSASCFELDRRGLHPDCAGFFPSRGAVPKPRCSTRAVWDAARGAGAPVGAVAHLSYQNDVFGQRARWTFQIEGTSREYVISDPECRILTPNERFGFPTK
jgi:hypothetical protein